MRFAIAFGICVWIAGGACAGPLDALISKIDRQVTDNGAALNRLEKLIEDLDRKIEQRPAPTPDYLRYDELPAFSDHYDDCCHDGKGLLVVVGRALGDDMTYWQSRANSEKRILVTGPFKWRGDDAPKGIYRIDQWGDEANVRSAAVDGEAIQLFTDAHWEGRTQPPSKTKVKVKQKYSSGKPASRLYSAPFYQRPSRRGFLGRAFPS